MTDPGYYSVLRRDAVEQLALNPAASHRWHALADLFGADPTPEARAELSSAVRAHIPSDGVAGFFRATFLAPLEADPAQLTVAASLLQSISPYDADRLMAFTSYQWGVAVAKEPDHDCLRARLLAAGAPALLAKAGKHLAEAAGGMLAPRAPARLRKVALVTPFIGNANHPPTEMALQQAELLMSLGLEVKLFSCQEMLQPHMEHYLGWRGRLETHPPVLEALAARMPVGLDASLGDASVSMMRRWLDMLMLVHQFDPDLVMFVGLSSPLMSPLHAARPVLGLAIHAVSPMAPVDVWLAADAARAGCASEEWGSAFPPAFGHHHPFRIRLGPDTAPVTRGELGIEPGQIAMITVGARLGHEIAGPWATRMLETLERHPQLVWVLAGGRGELPDALAPANPAQLRLLSHRTDLRSVMRCCDLYANPARLGGGLSVAEAMAEGLPALAFSGGDGGSKLAHMALAGEQSYFEMLEALLASPALRAQAGAAMQAHFRDALDLAQSGPSLMRACELAVERYRMR